MTLLILGLVLCLGTHAFTMARAPRARLIAGIGEGPYKLGYTALSRAGIVLVSIGYGQYREAGYIPVWDPPVWTRHLALLLVWFAFVSFAAAYLPGRIKSAIKHPMLAGVKIWAFAHLLANGDLGSMLLFGSFLAWAVIARISTKRRDEVVPHGGPAAAPSGFRNDAVPSRWVRWPTSRSWLGCTPGSSAFRSCRGGPEASTGPLRPHRPLAMCGTV